MLGIPFVSRSEAGIALDRCQFIERIVGELSCRCVNLFGQAVAGRIVAVAESIYDVALPLTQKQRSVDSPGRRLNCKSKVSACLPAGTRK